MTDPKLVDEALGRLGQHVVQLSVVATIKKKLCPGTYSGFLIQYRGFGYWITAGHVLRDIENLLADRRIEKLWGGWIDGFSRDDASRIPVELAALPRIWIDQFGLDLGVVLLNSNEIKLLEANPGKFFLDERGWTPPDDWQPDAYFLLGAPRESVQLEGPVPDGTHYSIAVRSTVNCVPVEPIADRSIQPSNSFWDAPAALFGRLLPFDELGLDGITTIEGMSGGPVFGIHFTSGEYRLMGIQSAWLPQSRVIRATAIEALLDGLNMISPGATTTLD